MDVRDIMGRSQGFRKAFLAYPHDPEYDIKTVDST